MVKIHFFILLVVAIPAFAQDDYQPNLIIKEIDNIKERNFRSSNLMEVYLDSIDIIVRSNPSFLSQPSREGTYPIHIFMRDYIELMNYFGAESPNMKEEGMVDKLFNLLQFMTTYGPDLNYVNKKNFTPSPLAMIIDDLRDWEKINLEPYFRLSDHGVDWNHLTPDPETYTIWGGKPKKKSMEKWVTPTELFLKTGNVQVINHMKSQGIKFDLTPEGHTITPMAYSLIKYRELKDYNQKEANDYFNSFKHMHKAGGSLNHTVYEGRVSLFELATLDIASYMIDNSMYLNQVCDVCSNESLLHRMASIGDTEKAQLLINAGADLNDRDDIGATPLMWAMSFEKDEIALLLIESGADKFIKDKNGKTAKEYGKKILKKNSALASQF